MKRRCMILSMGLAVCLLAGCQDQQALAELEAMKAQAEVEEQNKELMRKAFEEWNKGSAEFFMVATTPDYANHSPSANPKPISREHAVKNVEAFWQGFPDLRLRIEDLIAAGDKVTVRFTATGTHEGFMGVPATGNRIKFGGVIISRIEDGSFVEEWEEMDFLGINTQLDMELTPKVEATTDSDLR